MGKVEVETTYDSRAYKTDDVTLFLEELHENYEESAQACASKEGRKKNAHCWP